MRRYAGVGLVAAGLLAFALWQWGNARLSSPQAQCGGGRAGAVAVKAPDSLQVDSGNDVLVTVRSCTDRGVADLALLVSSPPRPGYVPALSGDVDLLSAGDCHRDHAADGTIALLCGPLAPGQTRTLTLSVAPHRVDAQAAQLVVSAVDVGRGGPDHPVVLDAASTSLRTITAPGGIGPWYWWLVASIALLAGIDMARRSRSGLRWAVGLLAFQLLGWLVWIRDRTRWAVVPAGSPPVALPEPRWARRYSVAVGIAIPVLIVGSIAFAVAATVVSNHSPAVGVGPVAATPSPGTPAGLAATPCAGGTLPAALTGATRIVPLCDSSGVAAPIRLRAGDTLALVLPAGAQGAGSAVEIGSTTVGADVLLDTGLGNSAAALLLARAPGTVTVEVVSRCAAMSLQCVGSSSTLVTLTVEVDA